MKIPRSLLLAVAGVIAFGAGTGTQPPAAIVFTGVTVLPMDRDTTLANQTVVVRDGKIEQMGAAASIKPPAGATVVDGKGRFLMPTIAEMHAHLPGGKAPDAQIERTLVMYVAAGVGTIRSMLGDPRHLPYRERVAKREVLGPRIYTSGPSFSGNSAATVEAGVRMVTEQKAAGYDLLKIHPGVPRAVFDAVDAKADELGIPYGGHVPADVGLARALEAKYRSIDHLDGYVEALAKNPTKSQFFGVNLVNEIDEARIPALVEQTKAAGTWMVPTQVLLDNLMSDEDPAVMAKRREMRFVAPDVLAKWIDQKKGMHAQYSAADRQKFTAVRRKILKALYDAGVPFALGSDAPQFWNVAGFAAHRELESLVAAGLTPLQALQTGTVNVAKYFGTESSTGTVAAGKRADLLLLEANPLQDIKAISRIAGVMINGRWLPRAELDTLLAQ